MSALANRPVMAVPSTLTGRPVEPEVVTSWGLPWALGRRRLHSASNEP